jgi:hypothetical protein
VREHHGKGLHFSAYTILAELYKSNEMAHVVLDVSQISKQVVDKIITFNLICRR